MGEGVMAVGDNVVLWRETMWRYGIKRGGSNIMVRRGYIFAEKGREVEMALWKRAASCCSFY